MGVLLDHGPAEVVPLELERGDSSSSAPIQSPKRNSSSNSRRLATMAIACSLLALTCFARVSSSAHGGGLDAILLIKLKKQTAKNETKEKGENTSSDTGISKAIKAAIYTVPAGDGPSDGAFSSSPAEGHEVVRPSEGIPVGPVAPPEVGVTMEETPLNPNASMARDIVSIQHNPRDAQVVVTVRAGARCSRPYLIGRLSGPALVLLEHWTWRQQAPRGNTTTTMTASYQAPYEGSYYLEVVGMFCQHFFYDFLQHMNPNTDLALMANTTLQSVMQYNFAPTCMENVLHFRLTAPGASVLVATPSNTTGRGGYWVRDDKRNSSSIQPVYTRVQPSYCIGNNNPSPRCQPHVTTDRYKPYRFHWADGLQGLQRKLHQHQLDSNLTQNITVCTVGQSHSREMWHAAERAKLSGNLNITYAWVSARFPTHINVTMMEDAIDEYGCTKILIAVGQWAASYIDAKPTLLHEYHHQLRTAVTELLAAPSITTRADILLRSIHYSSPWIRSNACPPEDWRTPPVMDAYNAVIEQVAVDFNLKYLDTGFMTKPIWDASPDWCHLDYKTGELEVMYLTAAILGMIDTKHKALLK